MIGKLETIGGVETDPSCISDDLQVNHGFRSIEAMFMSSLPSSYKSFYKQVGAIRFKNRIIVECIDSASFMLPSNKVVVGSFYCLTGTGEWTATEILKTYKEQLEEGLFPICDGELGDLICLSLRKHDYGAIYYFYHESMFDEPLPLIANDFESFINKLEIEVDSPEDEQIIKGITMELTPEFIELLKKNGYGQNLK